MKIVAMVTDNGTACEETALCERHDTTENREFVAGESQRRAEPGLRWEDCSENDAIACVFC